MLALQCPEVRLNIISSLGSINKGIVICMLCTYCIAGKFGELYVMSEAKTIQSSSNPLADLFICQTLFRHTLEKSKFVKRSPCQTFPL